MQKFKQFSITALVSLSLFFSGAFAVADVTGGYVTITIPTNSMVYGNYNGIIPYDSQAVHNNNLTINSIVSSYAYGGYTTGDGAVYNNTVTIGYDGSTTIVYGGNAYTGDATGNSIEINGTTNNAYGGTTRGNVSNNTVTINSTGIVYGSVVGGWVNYGSTSSTNEYNTVIISGTAGWVYGGWTFQGSGAVSNNTVTISGTVTNEVYAGTTMGTGTVINNTVNITSTATLTGATLYGSNNSNISGMGNTLNVDGFSGSIKTMANFENYNFVLGQLSGLDGLTYIEISGAAVNIDETNINISSAPEFMNNALNVGDVITVISSITSGANPASVTVTLTMAPSPFVAYDFLESYDTGALLLTVLSAGLNPQTEAVGEGFAAGLAFLGQAADLRSALDIVPEGHRFIPFAKMVYGKQHISTGSSIKVEGFSSIAGLALNTNFDNGSQLVVGAFIEGGWGDYNSRNSFSNSTSVKGKGDIEYYGGGFLAHYALKNGLYGEGSFAVGKTETDFRTYDFMPGTRSKYDYSVPYYSAHLAVGQVLSLTNTLDLDIYGKYLWTRQEGDNVTVDGYRFKFKAADSHRLRAGGKLKADVSPQLQPYVGAAYEYEFSGKVKGSLYGMNLDEPSLRGGTGIGELGLVWTPIDAQNLKFDLGVQGYAGKREGISGGLTVSLSF